MANADEFPDFDVLELPESFLNDLFAPFGQDEQIQNPDQIENKENVEIKENITLPDSRNEPAVIDVESFIEAQKKANTKKATEKDVRNVQRWLRQHRYEHGPIENIIPCVLNDYLAEMFISIRQANGDEYEPTSLESIKNSLERYLKSKNYPISLRDRVFHKANEALTAKKRQLKKGGYGNKPKASHSVDRVDEEAMFVKGVMGSKTPESLQFTLFFMIGKQFGLRGRDEQRKLKFGDISLKTDSAGTEYLEYLERNSKTRDGSTADCRETTPRIFSTGDGEKNPVEIFKTFCSRRPDEMKKPESPFYLIPKSQNKLKPDDQIWYYPRPMGANTLGKLVKAAAAQCGISHKKLTNHSVRKTCVSTLSKSGVPPNKIMQVTGHKNISSIAAYDTALSLDEQKNISKILNHGGSFPAHNPDIGSLTPVSSVSLEMKVPEAQTLQTVQAQKSPAERAISTAQDLQSSLFTGAFIQTINLNIQMK